MIDFPNCHIRLSLSWLGRVCRILKRQTHCNHSHLNSQASTVALLIAHDLSVACRLCLGRSHSMRIGNFCYKTLPVFTRHTLDPLGLATTPCFAHPYSSRPVRMWNPHVKSRYQKSKGSGLCLESGPPGFAATRSTPRLPCVALFPLCELLGLPASVVRFFRESLEQLHESVGFPALQRMADEQAIVDKALQCAHRRILGFCWSNDRDRSELLVQEDRRLRHDEVSLEFIGDFRVGESIEVVESDRCTGRAG